MEPSEEKHQDKEKITVCDEEAEQLLQRLPKTSLMVGKFPLNMRPLITKYQDNVEEEIIVHEEEAQQLLQRLPKAYMMGGQFQLVNYEGFWCSGSNSDYLTSIIAFQRHFEARDTDLIISSFPKTGTTWLKSLLFSVVNRRRFPIEESPMRNKHPHELVYRLEVDVYGNAFDYPRPHHLNELPSPRLFNTHLPYTSLPNSVKSSECKIIHISRNPMDTMVSAWFFAISAMKNFKREDFQPPSIEEFFEDFYHGKFPHGPFFDNVVGYWKESLAQPDKVLFLRYEDLKDDPILEVKRLAEFVGVPFSAQEESEGVVEEIIELCSIGKLKDMEGNKSGVFNKYYEKKSYFRKGEVGDWRHYLTPPMVERMNALMEEKEKLEGTGLSFKSLS